MNAMEPIIIYTTSPSKENAEAIARHLVASRLAACCSIIPEITSIFRWDGSIQRELEVMLMIKTERSRFPEAATAIRSLHSYDVPELVAVSVAEVSSEYFGWMQECLRAESV